MSRVRSATRLVAWAALLCSAVNLPVWAQDDLPPANALKAADVKPDGNTIPNPIKTDQNARYAFRVDRTLFPDANKGYNPPLTTGSTVRARDEWIRLHPLRDHDGLIIPEHFHLYNQPGATGKLLGLVPLPHGRRALLTEAMLAPAKTPQGKIIRDELVARIQEKAIWVPREEIDFADVPIFMNREDAAGASFGDYVRLHFGVLTIFNNPDAIKPFVFLEIAEGGLRRNVIRPNASATFHPDENDEGYVPPYRDVLYQGDRVRYWSYIHPSQTDHWMIGISTGSLGGEVAADQADRNSYFLGKTHLFNPYVTANVGVIAYKFDKGNGKTGITGRLAIGFSFDIGAVTQILGGARPQ